MDATRRLALKAFPALALAPWAAKTHASGISIPDGSTALIGPIYTDIYDGDPVETPPTIVESILQDVVVNNRIPGGGTTITHINELYSKLTPGEYSDVDELLRWMGAGGAAGAWGFHFTLGPRYAAAGGQLLSGGAFAFWLGWNTGTAIYNGVNWIIFRVSHH